MRTTKFLQEDGTEKLYTTPRQEGTYLYFTGEGDDIIGSTIGGGTSFTIDNSVSLTTLNSISFGFIDDIFIKDGLIFWENAAFGDWMTLEVYLPANTYWKTPHSTGNFDLVDGSYIANATWSGEYLMLGADYTVNRFVNKVPLMGSNPMGTLLESSDVDKVAKELKFRASVGTPTSSPIKCAFIIEMYRKSTV